MSNAPHAYRGGATDSSHRRAAYHRGVCPLPQVLPPLVVLLVDDNPSMRALIRSLVEASGPVVHECADGESAVAMYDRLDPDWVLMDLKMGGMDGFAATRAIRRSHPAARVVIVTEMSDDRSRAAAAEAGALAFVPKQNLLDLPALLSRPDAAGGLA
jgi:CheY-like chemotaxis protein